MDFLILFSDKDRVVIEIDGNQHYSDDNISSPKKYSEMVASDRHLNLSRYNIFRFGGYEFMQADIDTIIKNFFDDLFSFYGFNL